MFSSIDRAVKKQINRGGSRETPLTARLRYAAASLLPSALTAALVLVAQAHAAAWYAGLTLPSFAPPGWLAAAMGCLGPLVVGHAFYRVLCGPDWMPDRPAAIRAVLVQLGASLAWPLALALGRPSAGLVLVLVLLGASLATAVRFGRIDRAAGRSVLLCALWTGFSALVMLSIVIRN